MAVSGYQRRELWVQERDVGVEGNCLAADQQHKKLRYLHPVRLLANQRAGTLVEKASYEVKAAWTCSWRASVTKSDIIHRMHNAEGNCNPSDLNK
jgi:hypothetical protein